MGRGRRPYSRSRSPCLSRGRRSSFRRASLRRRRRAWQACPRAPMSETSSAFTLVQATLSTVLSLLLGAAIGARLGAAYAISGARPVHRSAQPRERASRDRRRVRHRRSLWRRRLGEAGRWGFAPAPGSTGFLGILSRTSSSTRRLPRASSWRLRACPASFGGSPRSSACGRARSSACSICRCFARAPGRGARLPALLHELRVSFARRRTGGGDARGRDLSGVALRLRFRRAGVLALLQVLFCASMALFARRLVVALPAAGGLGRSIERDDRDRLSARLGDGVCILLAGPRFSCCRSPQFWSTA